MKKIVLLSFFLIFSCKPAGPAKVKEKPRSVDPELTGLSRYLAGRMDATQTGWPVQEPGYAYHRQNMENLWNRMQANHVSHIRPWRDEHLADRTETVLYFFSGVDWLNLSLFFPDARRYVMISLEEPGEIPDIRAMTPLARNQALLRLYASIATLANYNYLMTQNMRRQLATNSLRGVKGVLLMQMGLKDQELLALERVKLKGDGTFAVSTETSNYLAPYTLMSLQKNVEHEPEGLRFSFRNSGETEERELIFLRLWISDDLLAAGTATEAFLTRVPSFCYMLKSASYFLHRPQSEKLARFLAGRATCGIQDDSGIPFRYFDPHTTDLKLYGLYFAATPLADQPFHPSQPDLRLAYSKGPAGPLPFLYGYGGLHGRSNVQILKKR
ncbi:MAG: hypothetical protein HS115_06320 [Spirochaetales bacterium]|nr:hypothetical protein [Spirochaetales bacterium]